VPGALCIARRDHGGYCSSRHIRKEQFGADSGCRADGNLAPGVAIASYRPFNSDQSFRCRASHRIWSTNSIRIPRPASIPMVKIDCRNASCNKTKRRPRSKEWSLNTSNSGTAPPNTYALAATQNAIAHLLIGFLTLPLPSFPGSDVKPMGELRVCLNLAQPGPIPTGKFGVGTGPRPTGDVAPIVALPSPSAPLQRVLPRGRTVSSR